MSSPNDDHREGLWDPERPEAVKRKRALPKSRVAPTLWFMIGLVLVAAAVGALL